MKPEDRRRFQRVSFDEEQSDMRVELVGAGPVNIFDISYGGGCFSQPERNPITEQGVVELHFVMKDNKIPAKARVIRHTERMFACEYTQLPGDSRVFIDGLISDRTVGLNMNLIDPKYYEQSADFNYWFHGPKETNFFIWETNNALERARLEFDDFIVYWQDGKKIFEQKNNSRGLSISELRQVAYRRAGDILSQMPSNMDILAQLKAKFAEE